MDGAIRPKASGYSEAGASKTRRALKGFTAVSSSPNEDINWNNFTLRQRARMLTMSSPVAASAINTNKTKVVGTGLKLKASINHVELGMTPEAAKEWAQNTENEFAIWANKAANCDAIGINDFYGLQQLVCGSWLTNGDVFALFKWYKETPTNPYQLRVHLIEADRISTPYSTGVVLPTAITDGKNLKTGNKIFDGVEIDKNGMVVAYHVCDSYPNQKMRDKMKWKRVAAYGKRTGLPMILHIMDSERCDQYRGVSYLAPVIETLLNISRYTQSELMAALIQSFHTAWIKTNTDTSEIPVNEVGDGVDESELPESNDTSFENENEYEMGPGTVLHLKPDEDVVFGDPKIPTQGFDVFVKVLCKEIGAALGIPYDTLLKEFNASYSASRAALMEAWESFKMRRSMLVNKFCQPTYERWLCEAVAIGRIKAPGFFSDPRIRAAWCKARWIGPVQGQLDPTKEVKANIMAVAHGYKTNEQVAIEYGGDWSENVEQLAREKAALEAAGLSSTSDVNQMVNEPDASEKEGGDNAEVT